MEDLRIPPPDEIGDIVRLRFEEFLKNYSIPHEGDEITQQKYDSPAIECDSSSIYRL